VHTCLPIQSLAPLPSLVQPSASPLRGFSLTQPSSLAQPSLSPSTYTLAYPVPSSPGLSCPAVVHACLPTQFVAHAASPSRSLSPTEPSSLSCSHVGQMGRRDAMHGKHIRYTHSGTYGVATQLYDYRARLRAPDAIPTKGRRSRSEVAWTGITWA
jgi:hypothetical protein